VALMEKFSQKTSALGPSLFILFIRKNQCRFFLEQDSNSTATDNSNAGHERVPSCLQGTDIRNQDRSRDFGKAVYEKVGTLKC